MDDLLILEDDEINIKYIKQRVPENITYTLLTNRKDFLKYIDEGKEAKIYFLDNIIPEAPSGDKAHYFMENCKYLLDSRPDAKIYYTGSLPDSGDKKFCKEKNIEIINRFTVDEIVEQELK